MRVAVLSLTALLAATAPLVAQTYPDHPVRVTIPFAPGGIADITSRILADQLSKKLGQNFVVDNQQSPGGIAAARAALAGGKDGYTLTLFTNGTAISVGMFNNLRYDPLTEFQPISGIGYFDFAFATAGDSPYKTLADFLKAAKEKPGALNIGTVAIGSTQQLSAELFKSMAGIDARVVPYRTRIDRRHHARRCRDDGGFAGLDEGKPGRRQTAGSGDFRRATFGIFAGSAKRRGSWRSGFRRALVERPVRARRRAGVRVERGRAPRWLYPAGPVDAG